MKKIRLLQIPFLVLFFMMGSVVCTVAQNKVVVIPLIGDSTAKSGYFTVQPTDLTPRNESQQFNLQAGANVNMSSGSELTCPGGESEGEFIAPVHLPHGTRIQTFYLYGRDTTGTDQLEGILKKVCQTGNSSPVVTELTPRLNSSGTPGNFELMATDIGDIVDNTQCHYHIVIDLELSGCNDSAIAFYKARIFWERN